MPERRRSCTRHLVAAELRDRDSLDGVDEDRNGSEVVTDCRLAAGENRAAGAAGSANTRLTLPETPNGVGLGLDDTAMSIDGFVTVIGKTDRWECRMRLFIGHLGNSIEAQGGAPTKRMIL